MTYFLTNTSTRARIKRAKRVTRTLLPVSCLALLLTASPFSANADQETPVVPVFTKHHLSALKKRQELAKTFVTISHRIREKSDGDAVAQIVPKLYQSVMAKKIYPAGPLHLINTRVDPEDESVVLMEIALPIAPHQAEAARAAGLTVVDQPGFEAISVEMYGPLTNTEQATEMFIEHVESAGHPIEDVFHYVYQTIVGPESDENVTIIMAKLLPSSSVQAETVTEDETQGE